MPASRGSSTTFSPKQMASGQFEKTYAKWFTRPIPPKGENLAFPLTDELMERIAHPSDAVD